MTLDDVLAEGLRRKASDWSFTTGEPVALTVDGKTVKLDGGPWSEDQIAEALNQVVPDSARGAGEWLNVLRVPVDRSIKSKVKNGGDKHARFRLHAKRCFSGIAFNLRYLTEAPADMNALGTPEAFRRLLSRQSGLIFVTGPVGSGKTTTLAACVAHLNRERATRIVTYEAPIEILHASAASVVEQHEVGPDSDIATFEAACESAMRENAGIIMLGEVRTLATLRLALELADTGHLIFTTLHTGNAVQTISRLIDAAPNGERGFYLNKIAANLLGTLSQKLIPNPNKQAGRRANYELLIVNDTIYSQISRGDFAQIPSSIELGGKDGMFFFDDHLAHMIDAKIYTPEEVLAFVPNPAVTLTHLNKRKLLRPDQHARLTKLYAPTLIT